MQGGGLSNIKEKLWVYNNILDNEVNNMSETLGISKLLSKVFLSRGISDAHYIKKFLDCLFENLHDPFLLKDMDKAVERICSAVNNKEKILIYGDYDVDGITSTSILLNFLNDLNACAEFYIPDRIDEGYGISTSSVEKIIKDQYSLIITVDCGVTAVDEVGLINNGNIDVIITDHHECKKTLPDAYAIINPHRPDCTYPFKELAGVGVVFKLIHAISIKMGIGDAYRKYLHLTAVGTIADIMPLVDENRIIVKHGITDMQNTQNIGLKSLIEVSGLKDKVITSYSISFIMAPRINAAGRIGDAGRAVELFTTRDENKAFDIAVCLNNENKYRQDMELEIFKKAVEMVEEQINLDEERVLVIAGEAWHQGVIGIVASKISEKYYRPCIIITTEGNEGKGSGRSIKGFNLFEALSFCEEYLDKYGGHEFAAGLSIKTENIAVFRKAINRYADSVLDISMLTPQLHIDSYIEKEDINIENIRQLDALSPFGTGNRAPVFAYREFSVNGARTVGNKKHLKLELGDEDFRVEAIGFNLGHLADVINNKAEVDAAFKLEINTWNSLEKVQLNVSDVKLTDCMIPGKEDMAAVYRYIRGMRKKQLFIKDINEFATGISNMYKINMNVYKAVKCIEVLEQLNLFKKRITGKNSLCVETDDKAKEKTSLENSLIYRQLQSLKRRCQLRAHYFSMSP